MYWHAVLNAWMWVIVCMVAGALWGTILAFTVLPVVHWVADKFFRWWYEEK